VSPGGQPPAPWAGAERVTVGDAELDDPAPAVDALHRAWIERQPVVVELAVDPARLRAPEHRLDPVYELTPSFEFARERLQFLVWANTYDGRDEAPIWWHGRKAARRFASGGVTAGGPADVLLSDGTPCYIDGGPAAVPPLPSGTPVVHRVNAEAGSLRPAGHAAPSSQLAPDQLAAVSHRTGAARVIAPAGSGKTRVLTERLRHLLVDRAVHPGTVTALAYNTKAASEMKGRCGDLVTVEGPHIRTLNSVGLWICNEFGGAGRLAVLEEPQVRDLVQQHFEIRRQSNTDTVAPYLDALSAVRLGLTSPWAVEEAVPDAVGIAEGFDRYRRALADRGAVDFDEQIYRALEILLADPDARAAARARCRALLVDEFQDLNPAHLLLIRLLSAPAYDCFGVGDDDQVIYGYAGATPAFLIDYPRHFPGATAHSLEVNYRCPPTVVAAARHLLSYNHRRLDKVLRTPEGRTDDVRPVGGPLAGAGPLAVRTAAAAQLAGLTVDIITAWLDAGAGPDDIAVLTRVNSALLPVQVACREAGVPCTAPLSASVLQRTGMRTAFAYLRIGTDPGHIARQDVLETIRRPSRGIAPMVADMLTRAPSTSVADIRRLAGRLSGRDVPKLLTYADHLDTVARACGRSTAEALRTIRVAVGLGETMDVLDTSRREVDRSTHADDLLALESVAALHPDPATFEPWLRGVVTQPATAGPAVLLSTVHRIKGREWPFVIVHGASAGLFPHRLSTDEEGERRVFHVALTRAVSQVAVLADVDDPSIFLSELDGSRIPPPPRPTGRRGDSPPTRERRPRDAATRRAGRTGHASSPLPRVEAVAGLVLEHRGTTGEVVELTVGAAVLAVGSVRLGVPFGSDVRVDGRAVTLVAPGEGAPEASPDASAAEAALRAWRSSVAKRQGVPPYVVLNDRELVGIAARRPASLAELARCKGMGQIRLERWGDEMLAVIEDARGG
jgi:DNA helicase-2/ATP-dependent DNA helicase PcrA